MFLNLDIFGVIMEIIWPSLENYLKQNYEFMIFIPLRKGKEGDAELNPVEIIEKTPVAYYIPGSSLPVHFSYKDKKDPEMILIKIPEEAGSFFDISYFHIIRFESGIEMVNFLKKHHPYLLIDEILGRL